LIAFKNPARFTARRIFAAAARSHAAAQDIVFFGVLNKKQGAAGITTAAPRIAGQWGRGITGCRDYAQARKSFPLPTNIFKHG
jgi:hypothetical protein